MRYSPLIIGILILLLVLFVFSAINLVLVFKLRQEWQSVQAGLPISEKPVMRYFEEQIGRIIFPEALDVQTIHSSVNSGLVELTGSSTNNPENLFVPFPSAPAEITGEGDNIINIAEPNNPINEVAPSGEEVRNVVIPTSEAIPQIDRQNWKYNVFGDSFTNLYYIDKNKTNFYYDENGTSFSFVPVYEKLNKGDCTKEYCGFSDNNDLENDSDSYQKKCLLENNDFCLVFDGSNLKYNGSQIKEFTDLFSENKPSQVAIYPLESSWLVGMVWTEGGQEVGRAWRFNGRQMIELDPQRRIPFITRSGYSGSKIYFGGVDDNYLVVYAGYDLSGFQVVNNTVWSLADFFNIRLADGGFIPKIILQAQGKETVWYICSQTTGKPKLIKMWQNDSLVIRGVVSLGEAVFGGDYETALCREGADGSLEIATAKRDAQGIKYQRWSFIDKGFDQSRNYEIYSANLAAGRGQTKMVNFNGLSLCGSKSCVYGDLGAGLQFAISNNLQDWHEPVIGQEYFFADSGVSLFWRLQANQDVNRSYYSPWFGAVNSVYYAWLE